MLFHKRRTHKIILASRLRQLSQKMKQKEDIAHNASQIANSASCAVGIELNDRKWYIAIVRNNTEKSSSLKLRDLGYEVFLPVQEETYFWKDGRKRRRNRVLLPGMVFVYVTEKQRKKIVTLPYINRFMVNRAGCINSYNRHPIAIIPNEQIEHLKYMLGDKNAMVNIEPLNLETGDRVRVIRGNLKGLEGNIYQKTNGNSYVVIRLENLCCASVRVSLKDVILI